MQVLLRLLALVFLLSGCGVGRRSHRLESAVCLDSVRLSVGEIGMQKKDIRLIDTVAWNLQRIVYFAPDSAGKQYPKSVTTLQMDRSRQLTDTGKIVAHRQTDYAGRHTAETFSRAEACRTSRSPGYLFCGVALLLALSFFLYKRLKSG